MKNRDSEAALRYAQALVDASLAARAAGKRSTRAVTAAWFGAFAQRATWIAVATATLRTAGAGIASR